VARQRDSRAEPSKSRRWYTKSPEQVKRHTEKGCVNFQGHAHLDSAGNRVQPQVQDEGIVAGTQAGVLDPRNCRLCWYKGYLGGGSGLAQAIAGAAWLYDRDWLRRAVRRNVCARRKQLLRLLALLQARAVLRLDAKQLTSFLERGHRQAWPGAVSRPFQYFCLLLETQGRPNLA
jgi:hypothetical protein